MCRYCRYPCLCLIPPSQDPRSRAPSSSPATTSLGPDNLGPASKGDVQCSDWDRLGHCYNARQNLKQKDFRRSPHTITINIFNEWDFSSDQRFLPHAKTALWASGFRGSKQSPSIRDLNIITGIKSVLAVNWGSFVAANRYLKCSDFQFSVLAPYSRVVSASDKMISWKLNSIWQPDTFAT